VVDGHIRFGLAAVKNVGGSAFDSLGARRSQLFAILDLAMEQAQSSQRDKQSGQISLFGLLPEEEVEKSGTIVLPDLPEWDQKTLLAAEKETVGFYLTGHPLDQYRGELKELTDGDLATLTAEIVEERLVRVGGLIRAYKDHKSKKGDRMAFVTIEDLTGSIEVVVFPTTFAESGHLLTTDESLIIQGKLQQDDRGARSSPTRWTASPMPERISPKGPPSC